MSCDQHPCHVIIAGSAADICKLGMVAVTAMLAEHSPKTRYIHTPCQQYALYGYHVGGSRLLVQIHDELLFEVPDEQVTDISGACHMSMAHVGVVWTCML